MEEAEADDTVFKSSIYLLLAYFRKAKGVIDEICWAMGLVVVSERVLLLQRFSIGRNRDPTTRDFQELEKTETGITGLQVNFLMPSKCRQK